MKTNQWLKSCCALLTVALSGGALATSATVSLGTVTSHEPWDGQFDVPYTIAGTDPAIDYKVAFEVTAAGKTAAVTNAAAQLTDGAYNRTLDTVALFGKTTTDTSARIRVLLIALKPAGPSIPDATGSAIGAIGDVMIVDISGGPEAVSYSVTSHSGVDIGTFNCEVYKTTKIVLRKVAAGTAYPVKPGETNTLVAADVMTPAKDYYIGVFPITVAQYARVMGGSGTTDILPMGNVAWSVLRGGVATTETITSGSADGFFKRLCERTGQSGFDLPTEVQWEIAARAGSPTLYGSYRANRHESPTVGSAENVTDFAVIGGSAAAVGSKCPNAWGLFDTAGNVAEFCRDDYAPQCNRTDVETPYSGSGTAKVGRGGDYTSAPVDARLSQRNSLMTSPGSARNGFRLVRICP